MKKVIAPFILLILFLILTNTAIAEENLHISGMVDDTGTHFEVKDSAYLPRD